MVDAYLGVRHQGGKWSVNLIGRNLGDEVLGGPGLDLGGAFFTNAIVGTKTHKSVLLTGTYNF